MQEKTKFSGKGNKGADTRIRFRRNGGRKKKKGGERGEGGEEGSGGINVYFHRYFEC